MLSRLGFKFRFLCWTKTGNPSTEVVRFVRTCQRFDCGDKIGFLEARIAFALRRPEMADAVRAFLTKYV